MTQRERINGSISVFLILVLLPLCSCFILAVSSVRYTAGRARMAGLLNLCGNAALNDYCVPLKQEFDLFSTGLSESEQQQARSAQFDRMACPEYSRTGLTGENVVKVVPGSFRIHYPERYMTSRPETLEQILHSYMKVRAPILFRKELAEKIPDRAAPGDSKENVPAVSGSNELSLERLKKMAKGDDLKSLQKGEVKSVSGLISPGIRTRLLAQAKEEPLPDSGTETSARRVGKPLLRQLSAVRTGLPVETEEYASHFFSCRTDGAEEHSLKGKSYAEREMYGAELEYLLTGSDQKQETIRRTAALLFAIRVCLNGMYAHSSPAMLEASAAAAAPLAEAVGPGAALGAEAILELWILAESSADLSKLLDGGAVPFYKTNATWRTSLSGGIRPASPSPKDLTYRDYLRLILLAKCVSSASRRAVLGRMAVLMQLVCQKQQPGFDLSRSAQQVELEASVSVLHRPIQRKEVYAY